MAVSALTIIAWAIIFNGMNSTPTDTATGATASGAPAPARVPADFYSASSYVPSHSVGFLMKRIMGIVSQEVDRRLNEHDLTNAQWVPLYRIWRGEGTTVADLARQCHADAGAMTRMLDRLEAKGLLRRVRSTTDRRVVQVELTPAGTAVAERVPQVLADAHNLLLAGFSREEWMTMRSLLERMLANAEELCDVPCTK